MIILTVPGIAKQYLGKYLNPTKKEKSFKIMHLKPRDLVCNGSFSAARNNNHIHAAFIYANDHSLCHIKQCFLFLWKMF